MTLKDLPIGKMATVLAVGGEGALRQHFLDMGIIPSAQVTMVKYAPMGDPVEVRIHSYELTRVWRSGENEIGQMLTPWRKCGRRTRRSWTIRDLERADGIM